MGTANTNGTRTMVNMTKAKPVSASSGAVREPRPLESATCRSLCRSKKTRVAPDEDLFSTGCAARERGGDTDERTATGHRERALPRNGRVLFNQDGLGVCFSIGTGWTCREKGAAIRTDMPRKTRQSSEVAMEQRYVHAPNARGEAIEIGMRREARRRVVLVRWEGGEESEAVG